MFNTWIDERNNFFLKYISFSNIFFSRLQVSFWCFWVEARPCISFNYASFKYWARAMCLEWLFVNIYLDELITFELVVKGNFEARWWIFLPLTKGAMRNVVMMVIGKQWSGRGKELGHHGNPSFFTINVTTRFRVLCCKMCKRSRCPNTRKFLIGNRYYPQNDNIPICIMVHVCKTFPNCGGPVRAKGLVDHLLENWPAPPQAFTLQIYLHEWIWTEDSHIHAPSYKLMMENPKTKATRY
jgi:hypothetical protein